MVLEVAGLCTRFHARGEVIRAVDDVSFHLGQGETLGLVGESGCGKSATALSILRLIPEPPGEISGRVLLDGQNLLDLHPKEMRDVRGRRVSMIFQDPMTSLNPIMKVGDQICEVLRRHLGLDRREARQRAIELITSVGIPDATTRVNDYPVTFSGGMRQRVMIALALAGEPQVVLADEITTSLDVTVQAQVLDVLRGTAVERGTSFILITHDLGIVAGMTQRVHVMYAGQIVEKATTSDLFANPRMPYTWGLLRSVPRLGRSSARRLSPIPGMPPRLAHLPSGCRFEPRCPYSREICRQKVPELAPLPGLASDHEARCWGTQDVPDGGWLIDVDGRWRSSEDGAEATPTDPLRQTRRRANSLDPPTG